MNGQPPDSNNGENQPEKPGSSRRHWLMMLCCLPMVIVAVALVATGTSLVPLLIALGCAGVMAAMMLAVMRG
jgi:hypothetical protein